MATLQNHTIILRKVVLSKIISQRTKCHFNPSLDEKVREILLKYCNQLISQFVSKVSQIIQFE